MHSQHSPVSLIAVALTSDKYALTSDFEFNTLDEANGNT